MGSILWNTMCLHWRYQPHLPQSCLPTTIGIYAFVNQGGETAEELVYLQQEPNEFEKSLFMHIILDLFYNIILSILDMLDSTVPNGLSMWGSLFSTELDMLKISDTIIQEQI